MFLPLRSFLAFCAVTVSLTSSQWHRDKLSVGISKLVHGKAHFSCHFCGCLLRGAVRRGAVRHNLLFQFFLEVVVEQLGDVGGALDDFHERFHFPILSWVEWSCLPVLKTSPFGKVSKFSPIKWWPTISLHRLTVAMGAEKASKALFDNTERGACCDVCLDPT